MRGSQRECKIEKQDLQTFNFRTFNENRDPEERKYATILGMKVFELDIHVTRRRIYVQLCASKSKPQKNL